MADPQHPKAPPSTRCLSIGLSGIFILHRPGFLTHVVFFSWRTHALFINTMLVTFHLICYVIAELTRPAWLKDARDITYQVVQAIEEAKKY